MSASPNGVSERSAIPDLVFELMEEMAEGDAPAGRCDAYVPLPQSFRLAPPQVYAVRLCGTRASAFSLEAMRERIDAIRSNEPSSWPAMMQTKMKLVSSAAKPWSNDVAERGANLLIQDE